MAPFVGGGGYNLYSSLLSHTHAHETTSLYEKFNTLR